MTHENRTASSLITVETYAGLVCDSLEDVMFPKGRSPKGNYTNKPIKVVKIPGRRIEFEQKAGEHLLLTTIDAVIVKGRAIRFIQVRKVQDTTWKKDLDKIGKSLRLKR